MVISDRFAFAGAGKQSVVWKITYIDGLRNYYKVLVMP
jgi:hypothetical protein